MFLFPIFSQNIHTDLNKSKDSVELESRQRTQDPYLCYKIAKLLRDANRRMICCTKLLTTADYVGNVILKLL